MTTEEYIEAVLTTENKDFESVRQRLKPTLALRLLHSAIGVCTEAGELLDDSKRHLFYGTALEVQHLLEEYGDILWYVALGLDALGVSFDTAMQMNVSKLRARYSEGNFDAALAETRDLLAEQRALEVDLAAAPQTHK